MHVVSNYVGPSVPIIRATAPGAEVEDERRRRAQLAQASTKSPVPDGAAGQTDLATPASSIPPRRYHLTKPSASPAGHKRQPWSPGSRSNVQPDIALFMEKPVNVSSHHEDGRNGRYSLPSNNAPMDNPTVTARKKRPKVNAAEKSFLAAQKQVQANIDGRGSEMPGSPEGDAFVSSSPSKRTQQILIDMAQEHQSLSHFGELQQALDDASMDLGNPEDYIYETYIRVPRSALANMGDQSESSRTIGFLVIEEEDQQLWETYADAEEESEWDEEDEDSNGKYVSYILRM